MKRTTLLLTSMLIVTIASCQLGAGIGFTLSSQSHIAGSLKIPYQIGNFVAEAGFHAFLSDEEKSIGYIRMGLDVLHLGDKVKEDYKAFYSLNPYIGGGIRGSNKYNTSSEFIYGCQLQRNFYAYSHKGDTWRVYWYVDVMNNSGRQYYSIGLVTTFKDVNF